MTRYSDKFRCEEEKLSLFHEFKNVLPGVTDVIQIPCCLWLHRCPLAWGTIRLSTSKQSLKTENIPLPPEALQEALLCIYSQPAKRSCTIRRMVSFFSYATATLGPIRKANGGYLIWSYTSFLCVQTSAAMVLRTSYCIMWPP